MVLRECLQLIWVGIVLVWFVWEKWLGEVVERFNHRHAPPVKLQQRQEASGHSSALADDVRQAAPLEMAGKQQQQQAARDDFGDFDASRLVTSLPAAADDEQRHFQALHSELKQMKSMVEMLLPYKSTLDPLISQEATPLIASQHTKSGSGSDYMPDVSESSRLLERLRTLEREKCVLVEENHAQRQQYERCLNDVTGHVIHVLLAQKTLRTECIRLQHRVQQLEQQNHRLQLLVQQTFSSLTYATLKALNEAAELCARERPVRDDTAAAAAAAAAAASYSRSQSTEVCDILHESGSRQTVAEMCNSFNSVTSSAVAANAHSPGGLNRSDHECFSTDDSRSSASQPAGYFYPDGNNHVGFNHDDYQHSLRSSFHAEASPDSSRHAESFSPCQNRKLSSDRHSVRPPETFLENGAISPRSGLYCCRCSKQVCCSMPYFNHPHVRNGFHKNVDLSRAKSLSPAADLLRLSDLYLSHFALEEGRMFLRSRQRISETEDTDSEEPRSADHSGVDHPCGETTASTVSLNDLLDESGSDTSGNLTPEGIADSLAESSDYERLVVGSFNVAEHDDHRISPVLPPLPPRAALQRFSTDRPNHPDVFPERQPPMLFRERCRLPGKKSRSSNGGDYTQLAEDDYVCLPSSTRLPSNQEPKSSHINGSVRLSQTDRMCETFQETVSLSGSVPVVENGTTTWRNGIHRPTVLLLRRRKRISAGLEELRAASSGVASDVAATKPSGTSPKAVFTKASTTCKNTTSISSSSSSNSSDVGCGSLGSRERVSNIASSDGSDAIAHEKPFSSLDDGYGTARSIPPTSSDFGISGKCYGKPQRSPVYRRPLGQIISSSEDLVNPAANASAVGDAINHIATSTPPEIPRRIPCSRSADNGHRNGFLTTSELLSPEHNRFVRHRRFISDSQPSSMNGLRCKTPHNSSMYGCSLSPSSHPPDFSAGDQLADIGKLNPDQRHLCSSEPRLSVNGRCAMLHDAENFHTDWKSDMDGIPISQKQSERPISYPCFSFQDSSDFGAENKPEKVDLDFRKSGCSVVCSVDGRSIDEVDLRQAIDMFSFLDDQDPLATAVIS